MFLRQFNQTMPWNFKECKKHQVRLVSIIPLNSITPMALTYAARNRGTPTPISLTIYNISPH